MFKYCRYETRLGACPLLKQPDNYTADTVDLTRDDEARDYWLACFEDSLPKVNIICIIYYYLLSKMLQLFRYLTMIKTILFFSLRIELLQVKRPSKNPVPQRTHQMQLTTNLRAYKPQTRVMEPMT